MRPNAAWEDEEVRNWLSEPAHADIEKVRLRLSRSTGVANGVLVVRTVQDCAELIWRVMTRNLQFSIASSVVEGREYTYLRENISGCIYRVVTGDVMLSNAFWNFYLKPEE